MAVHARIPWPKQPERDRLALLADLAEAKGWHRTYERHTKQIERGEKVVARMTAELDEHRKEAGHAISQANLWAKQAGKKRGAMIETSPDSVLPAAGCSSSGTCC